MGQGGRRAQIGPTPAKGFVGPSEQGGPGNKGWDREIDQPERDDTRKHLRRVTRGQQGQQHKFEGPDTPRRTGNQRYAKRGKIGGEKLDECDIAARGHQDEQRKRGRHRVEHGPEPDGRERGQAGQANMPTRQVQRWVQKHHRQPGGHGTKPKRTDPGTDAAAWQDQGRKAQLRRETEQKGHRSETGDPKRRAKAQPRDQPPAHQRAREQPEPQRLRNGDGG